MRRERKKPEVMPDDQFYYEIRRRLQRTALSCAGAVGAIDAMFKAIEAYEAITKTLEKNSTGPKL